MNGEAAERDTQDGGHKVLDRDTLALVLPALDRGHHGRAARIMLWTAARRDEVCAATWSEFDLDAGLWQSPPGGERTHAVERGESRYRPSLMLSLCPAKPWVCW